MTLVTLTLGVFSSICSVVRKFPKHSHALVMLVGPSKICNPQFLFPMKQYSSCIGFGSVSSVGT